MTMRSFNRAIKRAALALAFFIVTTCTAVAMPSLSAQAATYGVDFRNGVIKYILDDPLAKIPNTFEASIWIEEGAQGNEKHIGYIFGNEMSAATSILSYGVDRDGHLFVNWNGYERYVVFDSVDVRMSEWIHVAVVRNEQANCFEFYLNGVLTQTSTTGVGTAIKPFATTHIIGGDRFIQNTPSKYFEGKIRQVTLYEQALTQGEINRDRINGDNISGATRSGLIFNTQLSADDVVARDTSYYENDAYVASTNHSFEGKFFETQDYSLSVIPDWQMVTNHYNTILHTLPDFLLTNYSAQKIKALITVGDLADGGNNEADWYRMFNPLKAQLKRLYGHIPFVPTPGNHDYDDECASTRGLKYFNEAFPADEMMERGGMAGTYDGGTENAYYLVDTEFVNYIIISLEFGYRDEVLAWAGELCEQYSDRRVIITTHSILTAGGLYDPAGATSYGWTSKGVEANSGEDLWDKFLRKYPNIFMAFCGHVSSDDVLYAERVGDHGNVVTAFVINAQAIIMNDGLENLVSILTFDEERQIMYFNYYSTITEKFYNYQNQFAYSFNGNTPICAPNYDAQAASEEVDRAQILRKVVYGDAQSADANTNDGTGAVIAISAMLVALVGLVFLLRKKGVRR